MVFARSLAVASLLAAVACGARSSGDNSGAGGGGGGALFGAGDGSSWPRRMKIQ